tara:strand:+ start:826 stop:1764 length:939 start_codon:yes stop_codon:yes gene_type:complete
MSNQDIFSEVVGLIEKFSKPVVLREQTEYKKFPAFLDLKLDAKFISRDEDIDDKDYREMISVAKRAGIDKSKDIQGGIRNLIELNKSLQDSNLEGKSVADLMSRVRLMRVLYNLVNNANPSSAGTLFERLFALLFNMKVETSTKDNLEDVVSESGKGISLKLIGEKTKIEGSKKLLASAGGSVDYVIARKNQDKNQLSFYSVNLRLEDASSDGQFSLAYLSAAASGSGVTKGGVTLTATLIGSMDISQVVPTSEKVASYVNQRFNSLIDETEQLIDAVRELVGTEQETDDKAKTAEKKAEKARTAARKIQKK